MSWIQKLYETYERCAGKEADGLEPLMPVSHTTQQAQIEIVLDSSGSFRRASIVLDKNACNTMIPCTEESGGRAGSKPVNHPLCDKLQYVAGDYLDYGGQVTSGFASKPEEPHIAFLETIRGWATSPYRHPKLDAILHYVEQRQVVADLVKHGILPVDADGKLQKQWPGEKQTAPAIFKAIQNTQSPEDAFVRWRVEEVGNPISSTWDDAALVSAWVAYYHHLQTKRGFCMVTGNEMALAVQHPAKLRHGGDKAKLISSNDTSGYTFRGRFLDADEATTVAFDISQKAHNALRWLIKNQSYSGDQVIVSWAVSGKSVPKLVDNTFELLRSADADIEPETALADTAQGFSVRLARAIAGYGSKLDPTDDIVVMGLDSATPGRMSIIFYRELKGSEFLERLEVWHRNHAWLQNFEGMKFIGAPAPRDIAEAAYGSRADDKLRKATIERLLPCIIDGRPVPRDLVLSTTRRAAHRNGRLRKRESEREWEKCLSIACALFKGYHIERNYQMALELDRKSRDYLYGRLLAIAENIESYALSLAGEERDTTAARLMQRFADRPASTWRIIELALRPYMARLRAGDRSVGFLTKRKSLLDEVTDAFQGSDFTSDSRLTGEFLLGYHSQRHAWRQGSNSARQESTNTATEN